MCRVEIVPRRYAGDEIDRNQMRALMQQLEYRVLRIRAYPAPRNRCSRAVDRLHVYSDALAIRFHFELLEIVGKQAQPFVIGEYGTGLAAANAGIVKIGEGRPHHQIIGDIGIPEMRIHSLRTGKEGAKIIHPHSHRDRKSDTRPDRISPADAFLEGKDPCFVHAPFYGAFRIGRQRNDASPGVRHPVVTQPFERAFRVGHRFDGRERLAGDSNQGLGRIASGESFFERDAIYVGYDVHIAIGQIARERVDPERGAQGTSANADVNEVLDFAQCALVDRFDQHAHAVDQRHRFFDLGLVTRSPQCAVIGGAAFRRIDDLPREKLVAHSGEVHRFCQSLECGDHGTVEMGLRPVEQYSAFVEFDPARKIGDALVIARFATALTPVALRAEQFAKCRARQIVEAGPELGGGRHGGQKSFNGCAPATRDFGDD